MCSHTAAVSFPDEEAFIFEENKNKKRNPPTAHSRVRVYSRPPGFLSIRVLFNNYLLYGDHLPEAPRSALSEDDGCSCSEVFRAVKKAKPDSKKRGAGIRDRRGRGRGGARREEGSCKNWCTIDTVHYTVYSIVYRIHEGNNQERTLSLIA